MEKKLGEREEPKPPPPAPQPTKEGNPDLFRTINAEEWKGIQATFVKQQVETAKRAESAVKQEQKHHSNPPSHPPHPAHPAPAAKHLSFTDLPMENVSEEIEQIRQAQQEAEAAGQASTSENHPAARVLQPSEHDSQEQLPAAGRVMDVGTLVHQHFRLTRVLGEGMTGRVFLAEHQYFRSRYAVKVLHSWLSRQAPLMQQFLQSFRQLEQLSHPGLVRPFCLDIDPASESVFYFMDAVPGRNLVSLFAHKHETGATFERDEILDFLKKISEPLSYAHRHQRFGGNLQPSRILWVEKQTETVVQLLGFGLIASVTRHDRSPLQSGPLYAMYYASPEIQQSGVALTAASDVFSLGVIVYQMLTGSLPIGIARPPSEVSSRWPVALDRVMSKAMRPLPQDRYASVEEFVGDFTDALKVRNNLVQLSLSGESSSDLPASPTFQPTVSPPPGVLSRPTASEIKDYPRSATGTSPPSGASARPTATHIPPMRNPSVSPGGMGPASGMSRVPSVSGSGLSSSMSSPSLTSLHAADVQAVSTPRTIWPAHSKAISSMALSPDGSLLASSGEDQCLRIWSTGSWTQLHSISVGIGFIKHIAWSFDNRFLAFVDDQNAVQIWNILYMKKECSLPHDSRVHAIAWLQNGSQLYTALENGTVVMWNLPMKRMIAVLDAHTGAVLSLRYEPQLNVLVSGGADHQVKLWSVEKKNLYQNLCQCKAGVFVMEFSHSSSILATGHTDSVVQLRDFRSGHLKCSLHGHDGTITALAFGPNDRWLASAATDCTLRFWNTRQSRLLHTIEHHSSPVHSICIAADGQWMASSCNDNQIRIWDTSKW